MRLQRRAALLPLLTPRLVSPPPPTRVIRISVAARSFPRTQAEILPLLPKLVTDDEFVVRQHLAEQLRYVADVCGAEGSLEGYAAIIEGLLPLLQKLVSDQQPEVRLAAGESLVSMATHVKQEDLGPRVLTIMLHLAHHDEQEDLRMTAAVLLNELAEKLGQELVVQFVTPEVICLSEDHVFRVRKATALNMDRVCATAGDATAVKRLVPAFKRLSQDDIWGVRKACAESLVAVSKAVSEKVRVEEMIPMFERFASDPSKWVRTAAYQHLGPFLSTIPGDSISNELLVHFTGMAFAGASGGGTTGSVAGGDPGDGDLSLYCAYSFPAVALTLGPERWPELRSLFLALSRDVQRKVRRTLSHSLHEVAKILGPKLAEKELLTTFEFFLRDLDEVKVGAIRYVSKFLACLEPATRESYLPVLQEIQNCTSPLNWRFRYLLAEQLTDLTQLFSSAATFSVVTPLATLLLQDPVGSVRDVTCRAIGPLVARLGEADKSWQDDYVLRLFKFANASGYRDRLTFVKLCKYVACSTSEEFFSSAFLPTLLLRVVDSVSNVRLSVAKFLCGVDEIEPPRWICTHSLVVPLIAGLADDKNAEVRNTFAKRRVPDAPVAEAAADADDDGAGGAGGAGGPPDEPAGAVGAESPAVAGAGAGPTAADDTVMTDEAGGAPAPAVDGAAADVDLAAAEAADADGAGGGASPGAADDVDMYTRGRISGDDLLVVRQLAASVANLAIEAATRRVSAALAQTASSSEADAPAAGDAGGDSDARQAPADFGRATADAAAAIAAAVQAATDSQGAAEDDMTDAPVHAPEPPLGAAVEEAGASSPAPVAEGDDTMGEEPVDADMADGDAGVELGDVDVLVERESSGAHVDADMDD